jgi:ADP-ribosylglycohydrolase
MKPPHSTSSLPVDYRQRVYAGWVGKCIGVRLGAPVEGWTYQAIRDNLNEITAYLPLPAGKIFKPDDDTAMPLILMRGLQDYGAGITAAQLGDAWLNYLGDQRGTLWWGGYGVSTEHTAYLNLANGIPAPLSGSIQINGATIAEQIGGQIFSDIWGLVCPANPGLAADYAEKASSVSHGGNGIFGGRFIAALVSAAFQERDPLRLVQSGLEVIPHDCEYARVVQAVLDFHVRHPHDWRAAYQFLLENFGYDRYPGAVHIIPNAGIIAMGLLYGQGDFSKSILITTNGGWDTDCNVGNVGAILGVAVGLEGIDPSWREPMNDLLVGASLVGTRNLTDLAACADLLVDLGTRIAGETPPPRSARYSFTYPGSTQGFTCQVDENRGSLVDIRQETHPTGGVLRVVLKKLNKKGEARLYTPTCLHPADLSANFYGASFSPKLYPGQSLHARVMASGTKQVVHAALYAWDENSGAKIQSPLQPLHPDTWVELDLKIPRLAAARLSQAGVVVHNVDDDVWNGSILLDGFDWQGSPQFSDDFSYARAEAGSISGWTYLRGYWRMQDGAYHGSGPGINESYTGDVDWQDLRYTLRLTPLVGLNHHLNFRVQGALRSYAFGLAPGDQLALYKNEKGYRLITQVPFQWSHGASYTLWVQASRNRIQGGVIDAASGAIQLIDWHDDDHPYLNGQIGLSNFAGCHTRYESIDVG